VIEPDGVNAPFAPVLVASGYPQAGGWLTQSIPAGAGLLDGVGVGDEVGVFVDAGGDEMISGAVGVGVGPTTTDTGGNGTEVWGGVDV